MDELLNDINPLLKESGVKLTRRLRDVEGRVFGMDIESIVLNLVTNAYYFAKLTQQNRQISVVIGPKSHNGNDGIELIVSDSGPGVEKDRREKIWDPLFSTKVDTRGRAAGTGLGLSIVQSVVNDLGGKRDVSEDLELGGARFTIWLPLA